jgi:acetoin utilization deacetylase AcuC-like enzyme
MTGSFQSTVRRLLGVRETLVFHDPAYRLPLSTELPAGIEPRRADFAVWYLLESGALRPERLRQPRLATYEELALVHAPEYLESLSLPTTLAHIFAVDPSEVPVDEVMRTVRLACGATVEAAQAALESGEPTLNTLGGFHHAARARGGGLCAANDIAVAVAVLRRSGFTGRVAVIDLDAHPPDGTADCLAGDPASWIGSLSGSNWGVWAGVDETVLAEGCGDDEYLRQLEALLSRMPSPALAFVIAGGDVLAGDRLGKLGMTLRGARRRDARVLEVLDGTPSVWLPGGGYRPECWQVLAGTALVLSGRPRKRIPRTYDPLAAQFGKIASSLATERLGGSELITAEELAEALGQRMPVKLRLLGFYSREGLEYAFFHYGVLPHVERLGYSRLRIEIDEVGAGERLRLFGDADGQEHLLLEAVLERRQISGDTFLFVNWLSLRHPRARFNPLRPKLPGQEVPGLGLAREVSEMLGLMARRLGLAGVAFRPSWYHVGYGGRRRFRFVDAQRQGRFEATLRDLRGVPLLEATQAMAEGRVLLNGEPYKWEAEDMVYRLEPQELPAEGPHAELEHSHFTLVPSTGSATASPRDPP